MYNDIVVRNFSNPIFAAELTNDDAGLLIEIGNPVCGDRIRAQIKLDSDRRVIDSARFQAWGCATSLATGNVFCSYINGQSLARVTATPADEIEQLLGELDPSQRHCLEMLKTLFARLRTEFSGRSP